MKNIHNLESIFLKEIKNLFSKNPNLSLKSREVANRLRVTDFDNYQLIRKILHDLVEDQFLNYTKKSGYKILNSSKRLIGTFQILKGGEGVVYLSDGREVKIYENYFSTAFNGDKVEIALLATSKKRNKSNILMGEIVKVISRSHTEIVGTLEKNRNFHFVIPDDSKIKRDIYIPIDKTLNAKSGEKVIVKLNEWKSAYLNPEGEIVEILGVAGEVSAEIKSVQAEFHLPNNFPSEVLNEIKNIQFKITENDLSERIDFREKDVFTIDPEDAKDFDDALSIEKIEKNNYLLGIHIADVSHFVKENSVLDIDAQNRGTSVYMANHVIPMLPEKLSNDICSLKPNEDRFTFSCLVNISVDGNVNSYKFAKSIINSKKRFSYEEAEKILENNSGELNSSLQTIWTIAQHLKSKRIKNGSIDFESPEVKFKYDNKGMPISVKQKTRLKSHQLVEECMLLANKLVSKHISGLRSDANLAPSIYRIHDRPEEKKLSELSQFVKRFGYSLNFKNKIESKSIQNLLNQIKNKPEEYLINTVTLRAMAKAVYSAENIGHFGLGFRYYSHFTSPIRRYPDLLLHRILHENKNGMSLKRQKYFLNIIPEIAKHSSMREKIATEAERESIKVMQSEYMKRHIGDEFFGVISGVTHFGIFVEIFDILIEGLIPMRKLKDDYYIFDEKKYSLIGQRTNNVLRLGDKVKVLVSNVNVERKQIDLELIETVSQKQKSKR